MPNGSMSVGLRLEGEAGVRLKLVGVNAYYDDSSHCPNGSNGSTRSTAFLPHFIEHPSNSHWTKRCHENTTSNTPILFFFAFGLIRIMSAIVIRGNLSIIYLP